MLEFRSLKQTRSRKHDYTHSMLSAIRCAALSEPTMDEALSDMSDGTSEAEAVSGGGLGADGGTTSGGNVPSPLPTAGFDVGDIVRQ